MNKTPLAFRNLGLALVVVRQLSGQTQDALAGQAGFSKSQLSKYEKGKNLPKLESLERVLEVLGLTPWAFFKVMDMLDAMSNGMDGEGLEVVKGLIPEGIFRAMVTSEKEELICGVIKDSTGTLEAQVIARAKGSHAKQTARKIPRNCQPNERQNPVTRLEQD